MITIKPAVLDQARKKHHLTSDEKLAGKLGLTGQAVRNLRAGRSSPSIATLVNLRELTEIPLDDLISVTA